MKNYKPLLFLLALINFFASDALSQEIVVSKRMAKKISKRVQNEIKSIRRSGFTSLLGEPSPKTQLANSYKIMLKEDDDGERVYKVATQQAAEATQAKAKILALKMFRLNLFGTINSNFATILKTQVANEQLNALDSATSAELVAASKNIIIRDLFDDSTKVGREVIVTELYKRNNNNFTWECMLRIGYDEKMTQKMAINALKKELKEEVPKVKE